MFPAKSRDWESKINNSYVHKISLYIKDHNVEFSPCPLFLVNDEVERNPLTLIYSEKPFTAKNQPTPYDSDKLR